MRVGAAILFALAEDEALVYRWCNGTGYGIGSEAAYMLVTCSPSTAFASVAQSAEASMNLDSHLE